MMGISNRSIKAIHLVTREGIEKYEAHTYMTSEYSIDKIYELPEEYRLNDNKYGLIGRIDKMCPHVCLYYVDMDDDE